MDTSASLQNLNYGTAIVDTLLCLNERQNISFRNHYLFSNVYFQIRALIFFISISINNIIIFFKLVILFVFSNFRKK